MINNAARTGFSTRGVHGDPALHSAGGKLLVLSFSLLLVGRASSPATYQ
jgi:hypothetical protein